MFCFCFNDRQYNQPEGMAASINGDLNLIYDDPYLVYKFPSEINTTKASGYNDIPPIVLKTCVNLLYPLITALFNFIIARCLIPLEWKKANIFPIKKVLKMMLRTTGQFHYYSP